jgi:TonB family protein
VAATLGPHAPDSAVFRAIDAGSPSRPTSLRHRRAGIGPLAPSPVASAESNSVQAVTGLEMLSWYERRRETRTLGLASSVLGHLVFVLAVLIRPPTSQSVRDASYLPPPLAGVPVERMSLVSVGPTPAPVRTPAPASVAKPSPGEDRLGRLAAPMPAGGRVDRGPFLPPLPTPVAATRPAGAPVLSDRASTVFTAMEVDDEAVRVESGAPPRYPPALRAGRVEGSVLVEYVVDTAGAANVATAKVLYATHQPFAASVIAALPGMRFTPARLGDRAVPQLVTQSFAFRIQQRYARVARTSGGAR